MKLTAMQSPVRNRVEDAARHECSAEVRRQIISALERECECDLEDLVRLCASSTWNQVFLAIDRLSRTGEVRLRPKRAGGYAVTLAQPA